MWPDIYRIPRLIPGVPVVKVVMVNGQRHEVLRPGPFVKRQQLVRVPVLRLPFMDDVLETKVLRRTVVLEMKSILRGVGDIHQTRVPVAVLRFTLRSPVRPDAELRVAEPLGALVLLQRFPAGRKPAGHHWLVGGTDD